MSTNTHDAVSKNILRVDAGTLLSDMPDEIHERRTSHLAVFAKGKCLGISNYHDADLTSNAATFGDLVDGQNCMHVSDSTTLEELGQNFKDPNINAQVVNDDQGKFIGVVTRQSLLEGLLKEREQTEESQQNVISPEAIQSESLLTEEQKLCRAQQIAHVGSFELVNDGSPTNWSDESFRILGLVPSSEIPSRKQFLEHCVHPDDRDSLQRTIQCFLEEGAKFNYEYRVLRPDHSIRWVQIRGESVCDKSGQIVSYYGTLHDITDLKLTTNQIDEIHIALSNAMPGISRLDTTGHYIEVNDHYAHSLGYEPDELIGNDWSPTVHPEDLEIAIHAYEEMCRDGKAEFEARAVRKDGSLFHKQVLMVRYNGTDGAMTGHHCFMRDITERKQAEAEAQKHRNELAHVSRVSTMGEMATGIAHELNQPLAAIASYSSIAANMIAEKLPSTQTELQEVLVKIEDQSIRAGDIVRRLRDFVKKTDSTHVRNDLNAIVRDVARFVESDIRQSDAVLKLKFADQSPNVLVDEIQIQQVLVNLIRNALDAMHETPTDLRMVTVSTRILHDSQVELAVSDVGKGLTSNELDQVFNAFFTTKQEGMGMGLPISRSIIDAHEGKLWAKPNSGPGMTFGFTIPLIHVGKPNQTPIVFIVDDESVMRDSLSLLMQPLGITVKCFSSAEEFLEFIEPCNLSGPVCLIADVQMPQLGGIELLEQLKKWDKKIPAIMITGHGTTTLRQKAEMLGAVAFFEKPFRSTEILDVINTNLKCLSRPSV